MAVSELRNDNGAVLGAVLEVLLPSGRLIDASLHLELYCNSKDSLLRLGSIRLRGVAHLFVRVSHTAQLLSSLHVDTSVLKNAFISEDTRHHLLGDATHR